SGRQVYPAIGQLFSVTDDEDGCRGLRFRGRGNLGVNLQWAEQQQEEKESQVTEPDSNRCHGARIAPVWFHGRETVVWPSMILEAGERCSAKQEACLRG